MSEVVDSMAFARLRELAKQAGPEGYLAVSAIDSPTSMVKGKEYRILVEGEDDTLFFIDDAEIPVYLVYPEDLKRFEPLVDVADLTSRATDQQGRLELRVSQLVKELVKIPRGAPDFKAGDIVVFNDGMDDKPYIVAKVLTRDEIRYIGKVMNTLVAHDLLVFHEHGGVMVSILPSYNVRRVGSLEEWGHSLLAPDLLEKLTVFDATPQVA